MQNRITDPERLARWNGETPAARDFGQARRAESAVAKRTDRARECEAAGGEAKALLEAALAEADIRCEGERPWDLRVHDERFYRRVLAERTLGFGESYMDGWWDCEALDELCERAIRARLDERLGRSARMVAAALRAMLWNLHTKRRAGKVGEVHYDLGNDFFAAMLDPAMQYSCGYFRGTDDLAEAQERKLELICRKLELKPGLRLLDIGCGWGGLAKYAAQHYGCAVVGITISRAQHAWATAACAGLPVEIRLEDYRDLAGRFDRVVSVGMMEHVGVKNYRCYLATAARCLEENGLFLVQTISRNESGVGVDPWIAKHIFPNSMLPSPAQATRAAEGLLVLEDAQNLGPHYDRTLLAWERRFRAGWPQFRARYGERFYRMWRFYLLSCAGTFRARGMQLF